MEELMYKLLEQTPLVIVLVLGIWYFTKQIDTKDKAYTKLVEDNAAALVKLSESNAKEVKELNENAKERDNSTIEAIIENSNALGALHTIVKDLKDELK